MFFSSRRVARSFAVKVVDLSLVYHREHVGRRSAEAKYMLGGVVLKSRADDDEGGGDGRGARRRGTS